jgi:hypothetical protein
MLRDEGDLGVDEGEQDRVAQKINTWFRGCSEVDLGVTQG